MKTIIFLALLFIQTTAYASNYSDRMAYVDSHAQKTQDVPPKSQTRMDYTGTTSGYPIYIGYAGPSVASSDELWRVCKATDTSDGPTLIQCAEDLAWDDRAAGDYA